jgi:hypothetical protein
MASTGDLAQLVALVEGSGGNWSWSGTITNWAPSRRAGCSACLPLTPRQPSSAPSGASATPWRPRPCTSSGISPVAVTPPGSRTLAVTGGPARSAAITRTRASTEAPET